MTTNNSSLQMIYLKVAILVPLLFFGRTDMNALADDCDNWGRRVHVGTMIDDDWCYARSGDAADVKRMDNKYDYDYFLLYLGYNDDSDISETYQVELTNTQLTRPQIVVGTFYDEASTGNGEENYADLWFDVYGSSLGGMTRADFMGMVTYGPNRLFDGVYDYVNGQVVVVQESSDRATRLMFYAVPVGEVVGRNVEGELSVTFNPPDRGAYIIMVSNYGMSRRGGRLTGSYTVNVSQE